MVVKGMRTRWHRLRHHSMNSVRWSHSSVFLESNKVGKFVFFEINYVFHLILYWKQPLNFMTEW